MRSPRSSLESHTFAELSFGPFQSRSLSAGFPSKKSCTCCGISRMKSGLRPGLSGGIVTVGEPTDSDERRVASSTSANVACLSTMAHGSEETRKDIFPSTTGTTLRFPITSTRTARSASVLTETSCSPASSHGVKTIDPRFSNSNQYLPSPSKTLRLNFAPPTTVARAENAT